MPWAPTAAMRRPSGDRARPWPNETSSGAGGWPPTTSNQVPGTGSQHVLTKIRPSGVAIDAVDDGELALGRRRAGSAPS